MRMVSGGALVIVLAGCAGTPVAMDMTSASPPVLVRRDPVPAGATCAFGGAALHTGIDENRNGVLDDAEITATTYVCDPSTTTLIRRDPIAAGLECPAGGVAICAGIDDNGNGTLEDDEIDETARLCNSLELWEGDFTDASWSDPVKVAALEGARVVTGSLFISSSTAVRLPMLELVGGSLLAANQTPSVALPALRHVGGTLELDTPVVDGPLAALERIGGNLALSSSGTPSTGASIAAPQLTEVRGDLVITAAMRGEVSLPALSTAGALDERGHLTALQLDSLQSIGGDLSFVDPTLTSLSLPALRTVGRDLIEGGKLTTLRLDALTSIGGSLFPGDPIVDRFVLPALRTIGGNLRVGEIKILDLPSLTELGGRLDLSDFTATLPLAEVWLPSLAHVDGNVSISGLRSLTRIELGTLGRIGGSFMVDRAPALATLHVPQLHIVSGVDTFSQDSILIQGTALETVELGMLSSVPACIVIRENPALRSVRLTLLAAASCLAVSDNAGVEAVSAPNLTAIGSLVLTSNHTLHTADFGRLAAVTAELDLVNTSLPDLSGFSSLVSMRRLKIDGDDQLDDLRGLSSLRQLSNLLLERNAALTSLDGLEQIHDMSDTLELLSNTALASTAGLRNVTSISGSLLVQSLPALTALDLSSLGTVTGDLSLTILPSVPTLDGLRALTSVGNNLTIRNLAALTTLAGLDALTTVHNLVTVTDLPNVPDDEILAFIRRLHR